MLQWIPLAAMSAHQLAALDAGAASETAATILNVAVGALNLGLAGIVIYWFFSGKLHSDDEMASTRAERDAYREEVKTTQQALERTRDALMLSNARNETGTLSAEIIAQALGFSHRERRDPDDDRRGRRRSEDDQGRGSRAAGDANWDYGDLMPNHRRQREGSPDVPAQEE